MPITAYYSTTTTPSSSSAGSNWWARSPYYPYYQTFSIYEPSKNRGSSAPPPKEMPKMTDEEFDAAFNDLLFGQDTKPVEKNKQA